MPSQPDVPFDLIIKAFIETDGLFDERGNIQPRASNVWREVAEKLPKDRSNVYLRTILLQNRHNALHEVCAAKGLPIPEKSAAFKPAQSEDDSWEGEDEGKTTEEGHDRPKKDFKVTIPWVDWQKMKPVCKRYYRRQRNTPREIWVLPPNEYGYYVVKNIWEQCRLPCPYSMVRSQVCMSVDSDSFITLTARCPECKATAEGRIQTAPADEEDAVMLWRANDTTLVSHHRKRPLQAALRNDVAGDLQGMTPSNWRKRQAAKDMEQGDVEPPNLWSLPVLQKAKQQKSISDLSLPHEPHPVSNLVAMKYCEPFAGNIHDIGLDRFFVHYYTQGQLEVYKIAAGDYIVMSIDATGSLVLKLHTPIGRSGHIFLYEAVINTGGQSLSVNQMLSERQDANSILEWLNVFLKAGARAPNEVVIDGSLALRSAVVRAFTGCADVADYKYRCVWGPEVGSGLPRTYVRLDVNHFIGAAAKWKLWQDPTNKRLKQTYMRALGLLVQCTDHEDFKLILGHVILMASATHEGEADIDGDELPIVSKSVHYVADRIKGLQVTLEDLDTDEPDCPERRLPDCNFESSCEDELSPDIHSVILKAESIAQDTTDIGNLNPYYCPKLKEKFCKLSRDYLLWSAVLVRTFKSPHLRATSAAVEGDFKELKNGVLSGTNGLIRVDKFVAIHLNAIEGQTKIAGAGQIRERQVSSKADATAESTSAETSTGGTNANVPEKEMPGGAADPGHSSAHELNYTENWRGLGSIGRRRKKGAGYLNPCPEFQLAVENKRLSPPPQRLLKNGNKTGYVPLGKDSMVSIVNTCAFDVICQMVSEAYINYEQYRRLVDPSSCDLMEVSIALATKGAVQETLVLRASTLSKFLQPSHAISTNSRCVRGRKQSLVRLTYDCYGDIYMLAEELLKNRPSYMKRMEDGSWRNYVIARTCFETFTRNGITDLQNMVAEGISSLPGPQGADDVLFGIHLVIDVDYFAGQEQSVTVLHQVKLSDIPVKLSFSGNMILSGVVARSPGHFVLLSRRPNGDWDMFNDLSKQVQSAAKDSMISPCLLYYLVQPPVTPDKDDKS